MFWIIVGVVLAVLGLIALFGGNLTWGIILILAGFIISGGTYGRRVP